MPANKAYVALLPSGKDTENDGQRLDDKRHVSPRNPHKTPAGSPAPLERTPIHNSL